MLQKLFSLVLVGLALVASGCHCGPAARVWNCDMADCGDGMCGACGAGGIKGLLVGRKGGCMGCGEVYRGEWRSDPPPAHDPCIDGDCGGGCGHCGVVGCHGACLGNIFGWMRGYRHYPGPCGAEPCGGCGGHGIAGGCSTCGTSGHRAIRGSGYSESLLEQDWNPEPAPTPVPGKPIHKAAAPSAKKLSQSKPGAVLYGRQVGSSAVRQASYDR